MPIDTLAFGISPPVGLGSFEKPAEWAEFFVAELIPRLPRQACSRLIPIYVALLGMGLAHHGNSDVVKHATDQLLALDGAEVSRKLVELRPYHKNLTSHWGLIPAQDANAALALVAIAEAAGTSVPRSAVVAIALAMVEEFESDPDEIYEVFQPVLRRIGMQAPDVMQDVLLKLIARNRGDHEQDVSWIVDMMATAGVEPPNVPVVAKTSAIQREKPADVLADLLISYGDQPTEKVESFRRALVKVLEGVDVTVFGRWRAPDQIMSLAMKKADLSDDAFSDVVMISFERDDKIWYWLDAGWHER